MIRFLLSLLSALACGVVTGIGTAIGYVWTITRVLDFRLHGGRETDAFIGGAVLLGGVAAVIVGGIVFLAVYESAGDKP